MTFGGKRLLWRLWGWCIGHGELLEQVERMSQRYFRHRRSMVLFVGIPVTKNGITRELNVGFDWMQLEGPEKCHASVR